VNLIPLQTSRQEPRVKSKPNRLLAVIFVAALVLPVLVPSLLPAQGGPHVAHRTAAHRLIAKANYRVTHSFPVPGDGGWDFVTLDPDGARLFIARGTHVQVVETSTGKLLGDIPDTSGVHGVAIAGDLGVGVTSNGKADSLTLIDLQSLRKTGEVKAGSKPDAIFYDPSSHLVFAFNANSQDATVVDPSKAISVATIPLGGQPEFAVPDLRGHVFVNLEDKNQIAKIDVRSRTVLAHWPLPGCQGPTGLAIDRRHDRLFSVCANQVMTVLDAATGKLVATLPIGQHPDDAAFDPERGLVFSSNGDGTLTVVHQDSPNRYRVVQNVATAIGARTMDLDPKSHILYLVTAKFGPAPAPTAEQPHPRPAILPGSFELLVVESR
jgi:DNA-binding beta-propeller fold protein YncE